MSGAEDLRRSLETVGCPPAVLEEALREAERGSADRAVAAGLVSLILRSREGSVGRRDDYAADLRDSIARCAALVGDDMFLRVIRHFQLRVLPGLVYVLEDGGAGSGWDYDKSWAICATDGDDVVGDLSEAFRWAAERLLHEAEDKIPPFTWGD